MDYYTPTSCGLSVFCPSAGMTVGVSGDLSICVDLARRTANADIHVTLPSGIEFKDEEVFVNVIGRGETPLLHLERQYPGKSGIGYERIVGWGNIEHLPDGSSQLTAASLDLRPDNGTDVIFRIQNARFSTVGAFRIACTACVIHENKTVQLDAACSVKVLKTMTAFRREQTGKPISDGTFDSRFCFCWPEVSDCDELRLLASCNQGTNWEDLGPVSGGNVSISYENLMPNREYWFRMKICGGIQAGYSNCAKGYTGPYVIRPVEGSDSAPSINQAIIYLNSLGGGTLLLEGGRFDITTIRLLSNVHIIIAPGVEIHVLPGCSSEESNWFADPQYRNEINCEASLIPNLPENWTTKQDEGHSFWQNALFYGQRVENVKIVGACSIYGDGILTRENEFANLPEGYHADKVFSLKLCRNIEIGGFSVGKDLWYKEISDSGDDEPFYLDADSQNSHMGIGNMMRVTDGGHFVLLATGVDGLYVHDLYTTDGVQIRDILDLMGCNDVSVCNIYSNTTHDDIVKLGSDCSLGFTRTSGNYIIRNIIADTGCNVFQIGSETADDIHDICVDNLYVMAGGKAGFSASINDGAHLSGLHLNCGGTVGKCCCGTDHGNLTIGYTPAAIHPHRTIMKRTRSPFILTLSNRNRVIGAEPREVSFTDQQRKKKTEKLVSNVHPGSITNVYLAHMDAVECFGGSRACNETDNRWPVFQDQPRTTPMIIGVKLPEELNLTFPNGSNISKIRDVTLENITITVKGGNPAADAENSPPEQYGSHNGQRYLSLDDRGRGVPAHGCYFRHCENVRIRNFSVTTEQPDGRPAIVMDDVSDYSVSSAPAPVVR